MRSSSSEPVALAARSRTEAAGPKWSGLFALGLPFPLGGTGRSCHALHPTRHRLAGLAALLTAGCLPAESVPVAVLVADPLIVQVPANFQPATIGQHFTTITNVGGENSGEIDVEASGNFYVEQGAGCDEFSLDPGGSCDIYVYYSFLDPTDVSAAQLPDLEDAGYLTVTAANAPAPVYVKLIASPDVEPLPI